MNLPLNPIPFFHPAWRLQRNRSVLQSFCSHLIDLYFGIGAWNSQIALWVWHSKREKGKLLFMAYQNLPSFEWSLKCWMDLVRPKWLWRQPQRARSMPVLVLKCVGGQFLEPNTHSSSLNFERRGTHFTGERKRSNCCYCWWCWGDPACGLHQAHFDLCWTLPHPNSRDFTLLCHVYITMLRKPRAEINIKFVIMTGQK